MKEIEIKEGMEVMCGHCNTTYIYYEVKPHMCNFILAIKLDEIIKKLEEILYRLGK